MVFGVADNPKPRLTYSYRLVSNVPMNTELTSVRTTRNPDATRDAVLHAAFCEIHRNGFQGAGIAQILSAAKLTKGALYHYFPTKKDLGLAVIDEIIAPRIEALILSPLRNSQTPIHTLLEITRTIGDQIGEDAILLGCPLNNLMQEMSPLDEVFRQHLDTILSQWRDTLHAALRLSQSQGTIRQDVDCATAALFILSAWEGCMGVSKTMQSAAVFKNCLGELHGYISHLMRQT